jgi:hypothetical protein
MTMKLIHHGRGRMSGFLFGGCALPEEG